MRYEFLELTISCAQLIGELEVEEATAAKPVPGKASAPDFRCCFDVSRQPMCFTGLDSR
jgi:hypothetical protein